MMKTTALTNKKNDCSKQVVNPTTSNKKPMSFGSST